MGNIHSTIRIQEKKANRSDCCLSIPLDAFQFELVDVSRLVAMQLMQLMTTMISWKIYSIPGLLPFEMESREEEKKRLARDNVVISQSI